MSIGVSILPLPTAVTSKPSPRNAINRPVLNPGIEKSLMLCLLVSLVFCGCVHILSISQTWKFFSEMKMKFMCDCLSLLTYWRDFTPETCRIIDFEDLRHLSTAAGGRLGAPSSICVQEKSHGRHIIYL